MVSEFVYVVITWEVDQCRLLESHKIFGWSHNRGNRKQDSSLAS
jgi:hypothetical protein